MKMSRLELKDRLKGIKSNELKVREGENAYDIALLMMDYLGDIESEFRDDLIYSILGQWIIGDVLTNEQLMQILNIALDDKHLFYKIGEKDTDSVFMRAFSILIVASIIYAHRKNNLLNDEEIIDVKNKVIRYMAEEKDVRGYIAEGGWAHTAAHASDALDELGLCKEFGREELLEILGAIKEKVSIEYHGYICYEDERLAYATNSIVSRNILTEEELSGWVKSFAEYDKNIDFPKHYYLIANIRNYLNSLYYRLPKDQYKLIKEAIGDTVILIRRF